MIWLPMGLSISPYASMRPHMRKGVRDHGYKAAFGESVKKHNKQYGPISCQVKLL